MTEVPFVDLKAQYHSIKREIDEAIQNVIEESAFIGGKFMKEFEQNFASFTGARYCISVGNGTDALYIALKALGIKDGDEVITVANSFIATSEAVSMAGARVVFVDCEEDHYCIDASKMEKAITRRTRAIIPVHLYGQPADMDEILALAKKYNLFVIEDAAQAHGALYKGKRIGSVGDCACFSFFPGKNLGAYGDAGAITSDNEQFAKKARMFANHGRTEKYNHEFEGVNSRLDGLQAAILDIKLRHLDRWTERRIEIARKYDEGLKRVCITPEVRPDVRHVYHLYVIRVKERDRLQKYLKDKGVATGIHYPIPLPSLNAYRHLGHTPDDFPAAHSIKGEILSLPIHGDMTDEHVSYVIDHIIDALKG